VWAKVLAYNVYGDSELSEEGNGATIYTVPDAPIDLREDSTSRTSTTITVLWDDGASDGGSPIIDYRISWDRGMDEWEYLADGIIYEIYTATGLDYGTIYSFKLEARNLNGYSLYSEIVQILCAAEPPKPNTPTTTVVGGEVLFDWDEPVNHGKPLTGYEVYIR
jgi:hypothetical protein